MAKYYQIDPENFHTNVSAAIQDYYGVLAQTYTSISNSDGGHKYCRVTLNTVCDRRFRLGASRQTTSSAYHIQSHLFDDNGSAVQVKTVWYNYSSSAYPQTINLILSDKFILLENFIDGKMSEIILVAMLTNGKSLMLSGTTISSNYCKAMFTDDLVEVPIHLIEPYSQQTIRVEETDTPVILTSYVARGEFAELNEDGSIAYIEGLFTTNADSDPFFVGQNFYATACPCKSTDTNGERFKYSLLMYIE